MRLKITALLGQGRAHPSKYGEMMAYPITVEDENKISEDVEWSRKPHSPAPEVGQIIEADGTYDLHPNAPEGSRRRLKGAKPLDEQGNPITRSQSASDGSYGARREDPATQARIARSVAQKVAADFVGHMAGAGVPAGAEREKEAVEVMKYTEMFEQHLAEAGREAEKHEASENNKPTSDQAVPF